MELVWWTALLLGTAAPAGTVTAIIEIPAGSDVKYERDADGRIFVDRFLANPVVYPANYGSVEGTHAGDGDPIDVVVHSRRPIVPGARIAVRPIGVIRMTDEGERDEKIVAVPAGSVDPAYADVRAVADLPGGDGERIVAFFRTYKQDAAGRSPVVLSGIGNADEAAALLRSARPAPNQRPGN